MLMRGQETQCMAIPLPLIMGVDPSGEIVAVGSGVDQSRITEHVNIRGMARCGSCESCKQGGRCSLSRPIGIKAPGGYAEYIVVPDFQARKNSQKHFFRRRNRYLPTCFGCVL